MDEKTENEITQWMCKPENMKKLSVMEKLNISIAWQEYVEKIAPIILKHMGGDEKTTFLFKL